MDVGLGLAGALAAQVMTATVSAAAVSGAALAFARLVVPWLTIGLVAFTVERWRTGNDTLRGLAAAVGLPAIGLAASTLHRHSHPVPTPPSLRLQLITAVVVGAAITWLVWTMCARLARRTEPS